MVSRGQGHAVFLVTPRHLEDRAGEIFRFLKQVANCIDSVLVATARRKVVSLNEFESVFDDDFNYLGMHEDNLPDLSRMRGGWTKISFEDLDLRSR